MTPRERAGARLAALVAALGLAACFSPSYRCATDLDCDLAVGGRCELDRRCTFVDASCPTNRRYAAHAGPSSDACFTDQAAPLNLCSAGAPPALANGCAAEVCAAIPSCCRTGWAEACVQQAQLRCAELTCDTRIAITASGAGSEQWDVRFSDSAWTARRDSRGAPLAWMPPAAGEVEPRLVGFQPGLLVGDGFSFALAPNRNYFEATAVDFDRDGRVTAMLAFTDARAGVHLEVVKLDDGTARELASTVAARLSWGDVDHDAFPDGIAAGLTTASGNTTQGYRLLQNSESPTHARDLDDRVNASVTGGTGGVPIRSFDWSDFDGDRELDVVAYGYSVDVHAGKGAAIGPSTSPRFDCDPPSAAACSSPAVQQAQTFAGAALPARTGAQALVLASSPARALYRVEPRGAPAALTFAPASCGATCPPIIALVTRDLDGDHALDVVAIDADLRIYAGLASAGHVLREVLKLPTALASGTITAVRTSVSGAPR